jgi:hypothetical protein
MYETCDYCKARLPASDEHRIPIPKLHHAPAGAPPDVRGSTYWLVHKRCVGPATAHLRFDASTRNLH